jgi:hypothetical protein
MKNDENLLNAARHAVAALGLIGLGATVASADVGASPTDTRTASVEAPAMDHRYAPAMDHRYAPAMDHRYAPTSRTKTS